VTSRCDRNKSPAHFTGPGHACASLFA
jgi:hypothetical protein